MKARLVGPYAPLGAYLAARGAAGDGRVTLPLATVEATIPGRALPASARSPRIHRHWWGGEGRHSHAWDGWLRVGWRVAAIDLAAGTVTFANDRAAGGGPDGG